MIDFGPTVHAPLARIRIVISADAPIPAHAERDADGWTLTYRHDATVAQMQAALDSINAGYTVRMVEPLDWESKASGRRPGPPPRDETKRERNERYRREAR